MIEKRSKLGESQTLQQFSRDADEIENWIAEKLQLATEESYKDPANIQSKHQKHQAFEAELAANADRIQSVLANGNNLIEKKQCAGSEEAVQRRLESIADQWEYLTQKTTEKSVKLKEANKQRTYIAAVKDLDFWLGEVESLLTSEDAGKDLASVQNLMKKHQLVEADIQAHEDRIKGKKLIFLLDKVNRWVFSILFILFRNFFKIIWYIQVENIIQNVFLREKNFISYKTKHLTIVRPVNRRLLQG